MSKFEYRVNTELDLPCFDSLGRDGWELIAPFWDAPTGKTRFIFKREIEQDKQPGPLPYNSEEEDFDRLLKSVFGIKPVEPHYERVYRLFYFSGRKDGLRQHDNMTTRPG